MRNRLFVLFALVIISCNRDPQVTSEMIVGAWEVVGAERNGKETETLNGAYFEFDDSGTMTTNYLGEEETSLYEVNVSQIQQTRPDQSEIQFKVERMIQDTMVLSTSIQSIPFRFVMKKIPEGNR